MATSRNDLDTIIVGGETDWEQYTQRQKRALVKTWDDSLMVEVPRPVCGPETGDGSYVRAQVLLENDPLDNNCVIAEGFNSCICGLHVSPRDRFLARHFVGQIREDITTAYLKNIGHL